MPFIPHTEADVAEMLAAIGVPDLAALFAEIPVELRIDRLDGVPAGLPEMDIDRMMRARAAADGAQLSFLGAGAYAHHIPAVVWQLAARGEFYSAYTPYQAEASQGTLQTIYEFQSMIAALTGLEVANASLYDGASAFAEAILMAVRANRQAVRRVLIPRTVHPAYRRVARAIVAPQDIELIELPYDTAGGHIVPETLEAFANEPFAALVVPQPNFFGVLEETAALTDWAHRHDALVIGLVNPIALALLAPPGDWGRRGADIAVGEGQPLGIPLSSGGPYLGFLSARQALARQLPGRIVGKTLDRDGQVGYALTLQAREQHIRRAKATSNICTNQGLLAIAATIHMALLGAEGLARVASACLDNSRALVALLTELPGVTSLFNRPTFHEHALALPVPVAPLLRALAAKGLLAGFDLGADYPELGPALLVCTTELHTESDLRHFRSAAAQSLWP